MNYIFTTKEEELITSNYKNHNEKSTFINYLGKIYEKPWGYEYMIYQNTKIGIWILNINKKCETSLHCHFHKDTILINISGCFKINLYNDFKILNLFDKLYIPKKVFHGIHAYIDECVLMEIEIYDTDVINYSDKNDLLRIKDIYDRDKNRYETSVTEKSQEEVNYNLINLNNIKSIINDTEIEIIDNIYNLINEEIYILLEGRISINSLIIDSGSIFKKNENISIINDKLNILKLSNINYKYYNKIIYNNNHLQDLIKINIYNNIGLTCGCFDILHEGHLKNLKQSKKLCDNLFVCLSSDSQIKRIKGVNRPINNIKDRLYMLSQLDFVDKIILYDETNDELELELDKIMNIVKPNIWFKGKDYTEQEIRKKHPSLKNIILIDLIENKSTTNIIKKINNN